MTSSMWPIDIFEARLHLLPVNITLILIKKDDLKKKRFHGLIGELWPEQPVSHDDAWAENPI